MFNLKDLPGMAKLAQQAKKLQEEEAKKHEEIINWLKKISLQVEELTKELRRQKF